MMKQGEESPLPHYWRERAGVRATLAGTAGPVWNAVLQSGSPHLNPLPRLVRERRPSMLPVLPTTVMSRTMPLQRTREKDARR